MKSDTVTLFTSVTSTKHYCYLMPVSLRNPNTTSCIVEYIESKLGCSPNIIGSNKRSPVGPCRTSGQLAQLAELSRKLDEADDTAIYEMTRDDGCFREI